MDTGKFLIDLERWTEQLQEGDANRAERHLDQVYHLGASLVASKEFQAVWAERRQQPLGHTVLEDFCEFLRTVARAETQQRGILTLRS